MYKKALDETKRIFAWLIPADGGQMLYPLTETVLAIGSAKGCDVRLKRIFASPLSAEIAWDGGELLLRRSEDGGALRLNDEPADELELPLYHDDVIELSGESFRIYRADKLPRPRRVFQIRFVCEGEVLYEAEHKKGETVPTPHMPRLRIEGNNIRQLMHWRSADGTEYAELNEIVCERDEDYEAVYSDYMMSETNTTSGNELTIVNNDTYVAFKIPAGGMKIGGSKQCDFYVKGLDKACAQIDSISCEISCEGGIQISVNGERLDGGSRMVLHEGDKLNIAGVRYIVIGNKAKTPSLQINGQGEKLEGLKNGGSVFIGRDYQKMMAQNAFIGHAHAVLSMRGNNFYLRDNNSKNGTFVRRADSGEEIQLRGDTEVQIRSGDTIRLFVFEYTFKTD